MVRLLYLGASAIAVLPFKERALLEVRTSNRHKSSS